MAIILRVLAAFFGLIFVWNAVQWVFMPEVIAEELGMPLLKGLGGSSQIGDFTSFFLVGGALTLFGLRPGYSHLMLAPALLVLCAATFRILAHLLGYAPFAGFFIGFEIAMAVVLGACIYYLPKLDGTSN
jgi:hypothetical protein